MTRAAPATAAHRATPTRDAGRNRPRGDEAGASCACSSLVDNVAALLAGQMQLVGELASLRYEVTLLAGGTPDQAVAYAMDGLKRQRFLEDLDIEGFDARAFENRVRAALENLAADVTGPQPPA